MHPGYQPDAPCPGCGLAAAHKLLDDNGWVRGADGVRTREGQRLEFDYSTTSDTDSWRTAIGPLIQQNLLAIGIKLDISNYPRDQFFRTIVFGGNPSPPTGAVAGRYDIVETAYAYSNDPDDSNLLACANRPPNGNNFSGYCNQQADTLYQQELATPDAGLRQNIFDQLHQIYVTDLPFITLFSPLSITVVRKGTHNFSPSPIDGETINVWQWWCDRGKC